MFCQKFMSSGLSEAFQSTLLWLHNILKLIFWFVTNLKLDKGFCCHEISAKERHYPKEFHEVIVQALAKDSLSYIAVNKLAPEFNRGRDNTEYSPQSGGPQISTH